MLRAGVYVRRWALAHAPAHAVALLLAASLPSPMRGSTRQRRALLEQVAETTGGLAFFPASAEDLEAADDRIRAGYFAPFEPEP